MSSIILTTLRPMGHNVASPSLSRASWLISQIRFMSKEHDDKQIVDKPTPYERTNRQCLLCRNKIQLDYKNPRLISQFVSPLNGRVYDKHITGLCEKQQTILEVEHKKATIAMYMPIFHKNPKYNKDAAIVNPDKPQRPNPY